MQQRLCHRGLQARHAQQAARQRVRQRATRLRAASARARGSARRRSARVSKRRRGPPRRKRSHAPCPSAPARGAARRRCPTSARPAPARSRSARRRRRGGCGAAAVRLGRKRGAGPKAAARDAPLIPRALGAPQVRHRVRLAVGVGQRDTRCGELRTRSEEGARRASGLGASCCYAHSPLRPRARASDTSTLGVGSTWRGGGAVGLAALAPPTVDGVAMDAAAAGARAAAAGRARAALRERGARGCDDVACAQNRLRPLSLNDVSRACYLCCGDLCAILPLRGERDGPRDHPLAGARNGGGVGMARPKALACRLRQCAQRRRVRRLQARHVGRQLQLRLLRAVQRDIAPARSVSRC